MDYQQTVNYLYDRLPAFQKSGSAALKKDLRNIIAFCDHLGNPQNNFKTIHVAGTNGKGSSSHMIASVLQEAGYKTGLYTSPHLKDFRERFKVNGLMCPEEYVIQFIERHKEFIEELKPSFFEVTVALAFQLFSDEKVDAAVIEVGLGGRLDSTNIIIPVLSLITNIGYDHTDILGDTLEQIAFEKGGIIKPGVPVVISEFQEETAKVFKKLADEKDSGIYFSQDLIKVEETNEGTPNYLVSVLASGNKWTQKCGLEGNYQSKNFSGVLASLEILKKEGHFQISDWNIQNGIEKVILNTGLKGRWQKLNDHPLVICDTGHNTEAFEYTRKKLLTYKKGDLHIILGFSKDKDWGKVLRILPQKAHYYFSGFDSPRSADPESIIKYAKINSIFNNIGGGYQDVNSALEKVLSIAGAEDLIFIGGSTYLVAEINIL
ncbi:bifunctional folylpolyglutamate synthase/dihydrofolate synthase [Jiulongibacter sediminis]|uniref:Dihydrofolate synthase/folylpolyglutamate synthase n=1 Tax=Jiulongibacter sediminis TaxID=1605367 RepID=A0A0P7C5I6_9BACT|nr:folylpolyglutamate synthase/dihydrofolate synthase family protein [Jiulongibacter sediminis]KPM49584.1 hypothetical protein AFM12_03005 [Jiulongibacter sediminis]TBX26623.1 hypothetical protein TK44_03010 [Jiulongibacter sediminis]